MDRDELGEIERRDDIAVQHQERLLEPAHPRERSRGAKWLALVVVVDRYAVGRAVAEHRLDEVGEVADGEGQPGEAVDAKLLDEQLEDRAIADREQRLGQNRGERPEARALAAREDHRAPSGAGAVAVAGDLAVHNRFDDHAQASCNVVATSSTCSSVIWGNSGSVRHRPAASSVTGRSARAAA